MSPPSSSRCTPTQTATTRCSTTCATSWSSIRFLKVWVRGSWTSSSPPGPCLRALTQIRYYYKSKTAVSRICTTIPKICCNYKCTFTDWIEVCSGYACVFKSKVKLMHSSAADWSESVIILNSVIKNTWVALTGGCCNVNSDKPQRLQQIAECTCWRDALKLCCIFRFWKAMPHNSQSLSVSQRYFCWATAEILIV